MLKNRILSTLRFFDLQDYPLTLLELYRFLIPNLQELKSNITTEGEIVGKANTNSAQVTTDKILECLETECQNEVENRLGFYFLSGRGEIVEKRLNNYFFALKREKLIKKYISGLKYLPFIRGVALGGSQAMGSPKETSDIDLLIVTDAKFLWLGRTLATIYFQLWGKRRHGNKIANRFCLNHYLAGSKKLDQIRNLYSAMEYARLRPLIYPRAIAEFQKNNADWINQCFPNWRSAIIGDVHPSKIQRILERIFEGSFGSWLERLLKNWQLPRIKQQKFIIVEEDELSFHPDSKQHPLLEKFLDVIPTERAQRVSGGI